MSSYSSIKRYATLYLQPYYVKDVAPAHQQKVLSLMYHLDDLLTYLVWLVWCEIIIR